MGPGGGEWLGAAYANLGAWWSLRAAIIDDYRRARADGAGILNSRLDYAEIAERARNGEEIVVFTELAMFRRLGPRRAVIDIGSQAQPFQVSQSGAPGWPGGSSASPLSPRPGRSGTSSAVHVPR